MKGDKVTLLKKPETKVLEAFRSGEAILSSEAGPRCGCKTKGLCMRSQITYVLSQVDTDTSKNLNVLIVVLSVSNTQETNRVI